MSRIHSIFPVIVANIGTGQIGPYAGAVTKPVEPVTTFQSSATAWIDQIILSTFND
jgi:hypothetical protein